MNRLLASILAATAVVGGCQPAPITGRSQMMMVSDSEERQLGALAFRQVLASEPLSRDDYAVSLVEKVGRRIAQAAESPPSGVWKAPHYSWEFRTLAKNEVNAFCLPGGKIVVYSGILPISQSEAGLAAVLGHEVAHAIAHHSAERLSDQRAVALGTAAAGALLAADKDTARMAPQIMAALGVGATVGFLLPMSRTQESEADHIGLILMALAGYDPREALGFWERVRTYNRSRAQSPEWLSTHPADDTRINDIRALIPEAVRYYRPR
jgi:predicted Zn-dependent protease